MRSTVLNLNIRQSRVDLDSSHYLYVQNADQMASYLITCYFESGLHFGIKPDIGPVHSGHYF